MPFNLRFFYGSVALAALLVMSGCGNSPLSYVRVVNASPGLSKYPYAVQVGQTEVALSVPYGAVGEFDKGRYVNDPSGHYRAIAAGLQEIYVYFHTYAHSMNPTKQTFKAKVHYTIVLIDPASNAHHIVLADNNSVPQNGNFSLELVQSASRAGAVDVYLTAPGTSLSGVTPIVADLAFPQATKKTLLLPAGTYELRVTPTGNPSQILIDVPSFSPTAASIYTGFALDPNPAPGGNRQFSIFLLKLPGSGAKTSAASRSTTWQ